MKDWLVRALKTFVQAFIPVIIGQMSAISSGIVNYGWNDLQAWLVPIIIPAVSAGISAVWNLILEAQKKKEAQKQLEENTKAK